MKKSIIPCETAIDYFFPALKASIARELLSEYSFNQTDVASKLGVTQAAVSKYLGGHYSAGIKNFEKNPILRFYKGIFLKILIQIITQTDYQHNLPQAQTISHPRKTC